MSTKRVAALALAALTVLSVIAPAAAGQTAGNQAAGNQALAISVVGNETAESYTVTVRDNGTTVEGAAVSVAVAAENKNTSYAGTGEYVTDSNGTVELPAPEEAVMVSITATEDNRSGSTTVELTPFEDRPDTFGRQVSEFVHNLMEQDVGDQRFGQLVAEFVLQNNPGADNRPDRAGPPGEDDDGTASEDRGRPDDVGPDGDEQNGSADAERGPPEHARNDEQSNGDAGSDESENADADESEEGDEEDESEDSEAETDEEHDEDDETEEEGDEEDEAGDDAPGNGTDRGNGNGR